MPTAHRRRPEIGSLWAIFAAYRWRILATYGLFNLENLSRLAQPLALNDEVEREVESIERARPAEVRGHFDLIRRWRIALSDRDAFGYGMLETLIFVAMAAALVRTCARPGIDAGAIIAVLGYVLMYVSGIANVPLLVQQFGSLRHISRRLQSE